jgi:hypothetical protein
MRRVGRSIKKFSADDMLVYASAGEVCSKRRTSSRVALHSLRSWAALRSFGLVCCVVAMRFVHT